MDIGEHGGIDVKVAWNGGFPTIAARPDKADTNGNVELAHEVRHENQATCQYPYHGDGLPIEFKGNQLCDFRDSFFDGAFVYENFQLNSSYVNQ